MAGSRTLNWIPFTVIDNVATFSLSLSLSLSLRCVEFCGARCAGWFKKKLYFYFLLLLQPIGLIAFLSFFHISR